MCSGVNGVMCERICGTYWNKSRFPLAQSTLLNIALRGQRGVLLVQGVWPADAALVSVQ